MYLIIFEDGASNTLAEPSENDFDAANDGYADIYKFSDDSIERWLEGQWIKVDAYE